MDTTPPAQEPPPTQPPASQPPSQRHSRPPLPAITIEATARAFYKQAVGYGFALADFVRFVDLVLGIAMAPRGGGEESADTPRPARVRYSTLPLQGPRVTIRRFGEPGDRQVLDGWLADGDGRHFLLSTASGRAHDVDAVLRSAQNLVGMVLFEARPVGCVAYLDYDADQRRAELRKLIGDTRLRRRGLGREASELWVGYGLGALGLRKIYLNTLATHIRNIKLNEAIGFRVEGILRNEVLVDGELRDVLRMGLWQDEVGHDR
jgi:RimJ/RimL family protein N-acetyltransferase